MNKVVPSIIAISVLLITAGCTNSSSKSNGYSGTSGFNNGSRHAGAYNVQGGQFQQAACQNCGQGSHAVAHDHGHSRATTGQTVTHRHTGTTGHAHNGLSGSHSYVTTTAGRNGGGFVANNGGFNAAGRGAAVRTGSSVGSTVAKVAGALILGGIIYNAADDNNSSSSGSTGGGSTGGGDDK